jgi:hypothetical protein
MSVAVVSAGLLCVVHETVHTTPIAIRIRQNYKANDPTRASVGGEPR